MYIHIDLYVLISRYYIIFHFISSSAAPKDAEFESLRTSHGLSPSHPVEPPTTRCSTTNCPDFAASTSLCPSCFESLIQFRDFTNYDFHFFSMISIETRGPQVCATAAQRQEEDDEEEQGEERIRMLIFY